jgi:hypothetical protein
MSLRLSRRQCVALLGTSPLLAQTAVPLSTPPAAPEQRVEKAKSDVREISGKLATIELPMDIEPAFHFRA